MQIKGLNGGFRTMAATKSGDLPNAPSATTRSALQSRRMDCLLRGRKAGRRWRRLVRHEVPLH